MDTTAPFPWWRKDASVFAALIALGVVAFSLTYVISKTYARRQDSLARHWLRQGTDDLQAGQSARAVIDLRTALLYSHDNPNYRLRLAQALAANHQTSQAIAYFLNLWEEQPGNGLYNLELARLYSRENDARQASRYYNGAIYGAWETDPAASRRQARSEYIRFLLDHKSTTQAQAEAIILTSGVVPSDIPARFLAADTLLETGEYDRALDEYASLMKNDVARAAFGAGQAAFRSGRFQSAVKYFTVANENHFSDPNIQSLLQRSRLVLDSDPDRRRLSAAERAKRVADAFDTAGDRLQTCAGILNQPLQAEPPSTGLQKLYDEWSAANPGVSTRKLRKDPDLRDSTMDLVSRVEQTTAQLCGPPSGKDWALLMLATYNEGVEH